MNKLNRLDFTKKKLDFPENSKITIENQGSNE